MFRFIAIGVLVVAALLSSVVEGESSSLRSSTQESQDIACCQDDCTTAICVPPFVSICSGCKDKKHEKFMLDKLSETDVIHINSQPSPQTDCCNDKCAVAICVPPFAFVCMGCKPKSFLEEEEDTVVHSLEEEENVHVPYKHCCPKNCKSQICVPPFVAICTHCEQHALFSSLD